ncbi:MAG: cytochrome c [Rhodospirillaceae bacterium]|nr:cytochrome c [Rhodospirillales bacterium]
MAFAGAALAVSLMAAWLALTNQTMDSGNARQVALGAQVYAGHCAECHGAKLEGEPDWRIRKPDGQLPAPPHDLSGHTWHHPDEQLFAITKHGMSRFAPADYKTAMPAFIGKLSDSQIRAVIAYIKSTWPEDIQRRQDALNRN